MRISVLVSCFVFALFACKKGVDDLPATIPPRDSVVVVVPPVVAVDPANPASIGFFQSEWIAKNFVAPTFIDTVMPANGGVTININTAAVQVKVPLSIFGNNANVYMTQMVTESVLLNHIKNLRPNILRFPGGNLSSVYFWNAENNARPADVPETLLDANGVGYKNYYWYGKNTDSWTLSLDNYYSMLQQTGTQGIITVNYGYARYGTSQNPVAAAAHLAADWVRYDRGRTKYWEVGNESNGTWQAGYKIDVAANKDGQPAVVTGDLYGRHFEVFKDSMVKAAQEIGATIYVGAQLLEQEPAPWSNATDKSWNSGVLATGGKKADYLIIHSYYTNFGENSTASAVLNSAVIHTKKMMDYVKASTTSAGSPMLPVALTEWNIFAEGSMQQVSNINGLHATLVLGELLKNKFGMASRWDLANGWGNGNDHGMFNAGDEPGSVKWNPRPAFYHMYYFQKMIGDRLVDATVTGSSDVNAYASTYTSGQAGVIVVNRSNVATAASLTFQNFTPKGRVYWYTLVGGTDNGEFSRKVLVNGKGPSLVSGGPEDYLNVKAYSATITNKVTITLPARSAVYLVAENK